MTYRKRQSKSEWTGGKEARGGNFASAQLCVNYCWKTERTLRVAFGRKGSKRCYRDGKCRCLCEQGTKLESSQHYDAYQGTRVSQIVKPKAPTDPCSGILEQAASDAPGVMVTLLPDQSGFVKSRDEMQITLLVAKRWWNKKTSTISMNFLGEPKRRKRRDVQKFSFNIDDYAGSNWSQDTATGLQKCAYLLTCKAKWSDWFNYVPWVDSQDKKEYVANLAVSLREKAAFKWDKRISSSTVHREFTRKIPIRLRVPHIINVTLPNMFVHDVRNVYVTPTIVEFSQTRKMSRADQASFRLHLRFDTTIQWPYKLDPKSFKLGKYPFGIVKKKQENSNTRDCSNYQPVGNTRLCFQSWSFLWDMEILKDCSLVGSYEFSWDVTCEKGLSKEDCPFMNGVTDRHRKFAWTELTEDQAPALWKVCPTVVGKIPIQVQFMTYREFNFQMNTHGEQKQAYTPGHRIYSELILTGPYHYANFKEARILSIKTMFYETSDAYRNKRGKEAILYKYPDVTAEGKKTCVATSCGGGPRENFAYYDLVPFKSGEDGHPTAIKARFAFTLDANLYPPPDGPGEYARLAVIVTVLVRYDNVVTRRRLVTETQTTTIGTQAPSGQGRSLESTTPKNVIVITSQSNFAEYLYVNDRRQYRELVEKGEIVELPDHTRSKVARREHVRGPAAPKASPDNPLLIVVLILSIMLVFLLAYASYTWAPETKEYQGIANEFEEQPMKLEMSERHQALEGKRQLVPMQIPILTSEEDFPRRKWSDDESSDILQSSPTKSPQSMKEDPFASIHAQSASPDSHHLSHNPEEDPFDPSLIGPSTPLVQITGKPNEWTQV